MIFFPPAKINLGLHILSKRSDGYHAIESVMVEVPVTDVLEIVPNETFVFKQTGLIVDGNQEDNLCVKAYRALEKRISLPPAFIHLRKNIPMGAGMGGGSADAAYVLKGLKTTFDLEISDADLETIAGELGSDCPFFIRGGAQLCEGRGELLSPIQLDLSGHYVKIVNPGIHIGTAEAYSGVNPHEGRPSLTEVLSMDINLWKDALVNDFEASIFSKHPSISERKDQLYKEGAVYASMTGSGSTLFGIYTDMPDYSFPDDYEKIVML